MLASSLILGLALALQSPDTTSADGRWVARVHKARGQERVDDRLARWILTVQGAGEAEPAWSCPYRHRGVAGRTLLSDDGSTFVLVPELFSEARPVVRVYRHGKLFAELIGREFGLERADVARTTSSASWLDEAGDEASLVWRESELGHWLALELSSARDWTRTVDLSVGEVWSPHRALPSVEPVVDPEFASLAQPPYVTALHVPPHTLFGLPVRVRVVGSHPTPNWQLGGFGLEWLDDEGLSFAIHPRSLPPPARTLTAQVIEGFDSVAYLHGLAPGRYTVTATGKGEPLALQAFEVLPGRLRVRLSISGGIAGVSDSVELYVPGVARTVRGMHGDEGPRLAYADTAVLERIDRLLPNLPTSPRSSRTTLASDFFEYQLEWWSGERWLAVTVDDGTARGPVRELIELLRAL
jgi:hypothetical protein